MSGRLWSEPRRGDPTLVVQVCDSVADGVAVGAIAERLSGQLTSEGVPNVLITFDGSRSGVARTLGPDWGRVPYLARRLLASQLARVVVERCTGEAAVVVSHEQLLRRANIQIAHSAPWRNKDRARGLRTVLRAINASTQARRLKSFSSDQWTLAVSPVLENELRAEGVDSVSSPEWLQRLALKAAEAPRLSAPAVPLRMLLVAQGGLERKGLSAAVEFCSRVASSVSEVEIELQIVGHVNERERAIAQRSVAVPNRMSVAFTGVLPRVRVVGLLREVDAALVFSDFEAMSFVALEAASVGTAVVVSGEVGATGILGDSCVSREEFARWCLDDRAAQAMKRRLAARGQAGKERLMDRSADMPSKLWAELQTGLSDR